MFPYQLQVVALPVKSNFRSLKIREVAVFEGPAGWSEFAPFIEYQNKEAWTWEHQALVRARYVNGHESLGQRFAAVRKRVLAKKRSGDRKIWLEKNGDQAEII